mgnify:CR=1 FL=1
MLLAFLALRTRPLACVVLLVLSAPHLLPCLVSSTFFEPLGENGPVCRAEVMIHVTQSCKNRRVLLNVDSQATRQGNTCVRKRANAIIRITVHNSIELPVTTKKALNRLDQGGVVGGASQSMQKDDAGVRRQGLQRRRDTENGEFNHCRRRDATRRTVSSITEGICLWGIQLLKRWATQRRQATFLGRVRIRNPREYEWNELGMEYVT